MYPFTHSFNKDVLNTYQMIVSLGTVDIMRDTGATEIVKNVR